MTVRGRSSAAVPEPTDLGQQRAGTVAARSSAAAERAQATMRRLEELRQRIERLHTGQASTAEDVARARRAAAAQRRASAKAQRRLTWALGGLEHRRPETRVVAAPPGATRTRCDRELQEAFVSLVTWGIPGDRSQSGHDRCRWLTEALIHRAAETGRWTEALCSIAVRELPRVHGAAVTSYDQSLVPHPYAAADDWSGELEELQQVLGEGPGRTAYLTCMPLSIDDVTDEGARWPGYAPAAAASGLVGIWAFPAMLECAGLGTLTLYRSSGAAPAQGSSEWSDALVLSRLAAAAMVIDAAAPANHRSGQDEPWGVVEVAAGVLAVRLGIEVSEALALIRAHAFGTGMRIAAVADDVLAGRSEIG